MRIKEVNTTSTSNGRVPFTVVALESLLKGDSILKQRISCRHLNACTPTYKNKRVRV